MNPLSLKTYLQNDINEKVENNNSHGVIREILIELKKNLSTLAYCLKIKDHMPEAKSKMFFKIVNSYLYFTIKFRL